MVKIMTLLGLFKFLRRTTAVVKKAIFKQTLLLVPLPTKSQKRALLMGAPQSI